jgi:hypothetical protein
MSRDRKKPSKSINNKANKNKKIETKIKVNNNMRTYLILIRPNMKIKVQREEGGREKNIQWQSIIP